MASQVATLEENKFRAHRVVIDPFVSHDRNGRKSSTSHAAELFRARNLGRKLFLRSASTATISFGDRAEDDPTNINEEINRPKAKVRADRSISARRRLGKNRTSMFEIVDPTTAERHISAELETPCALRQKRNKNRLPKREGGGGKRGEIMYILGFTSMLLT